METDPSQSPTSGFANRADPAEDAAPRSSGRPRSGPTNSRTTRAWVLRRGKTGEPGVLVDAEVPLPPLGDEGILVETMYGSWEGNMTHALQRDPVDICARNGQDWQVLGNGAVVQVLETGADVTRPAAGDLCCLVPVGRVDEHGHLETVWAYDEPNTMGALAERFVVTAGQLTRVPGDGHFHPSQWASFAVRFVTAWSNWKVAYGALRLQRPDVDPRDVTVWAWGGGVAYAELRLALAEGCRAFMLCTGEHRAHCLEEAGIEPVDRAPYAAMFDSDRDTDRRAKVAAMRAERALERRVRESTGGRGSSVFIDNIGGPAASVALRSLERLGVIASCGWKHDLRLAINRANECIGRHIHIHTHAGTLAEGLRAAEYAVEDGWIAPRQDRIWGWEEIPELARRCVTGEERSYFPTFRGPAAG